jgi:hypothetical protein
VSYRSYRLKDTEAVIDEKDTGKVNGILKRIKQHLYYSFGGEIPLKVLDFLSTVKEAMDLNHVSEGVAAIILPYLLTGEAKDGVISMRNCASLKVPKYPAAVAWILESYATDAAIEAAAEKFLTAKQQAGEGEDAFATRLRRYAAEAVNVYKEDALVSRYLAGLASYTANAIRGPRLSSYEVHPKSRTSPYKLALREGKQASPAAVQPAPPFRVYSPLAPEEWLPLWMVFVRPVSSLNPIRTKWTRPWWPPQSMRPTSGPVPSCLDQPRRSLVPPGVGLVLLRLRDRNLRWQ